MLFGLGLVGLEFGGWGQTPGINHALVISNQTNECPPMEKTTRPWPVVSLKDTMGTMGRDPQINEEDIFGPENFIARPPRRIMTFPETRVELNRLIKKIKPELRSESFQNYKNTFSACTRVRVCGRTDILFS